MPRGRNATRPTDIPAKGWIDIGARIWTRLGALHIGLLAAGIAFYGLLSVFPGITAAIAMVGLFYDPTLLVSQSEWLLTLMPQAAAEVLEGQLSQVAGADEGALGLTALLSLALALWTASNALGSFIQSLNLIYEERETRSFVVVKLVTIALTVAMIFGLATSVIVVAAIPAVLSFFSSEPSWTATALAVRWPVMILIGIGGIAALYRFGPDRRGARWRWLTPGAALACLLWVAGSFGFSAYVQSFSSYNETFGALAGVIILLTWMWLSAFVVLLGATLDAEIEAQTSRDTTTGPEKPMGERGAVKADNLGEKRGVTADKFPEPTPPSAR